MSKWTYFPLDTIWGIRRAEGKMLQSLKRKEISYCETGNEES